MFELYRLRPQTKLKFWSSWLWTSMWTDIPCQFDTSFILSSGCFHKLISHEYNWYSTSNVWRLCKSRNLLTLIWQNLVIKFCLLKVTSSLAFVHRKIFQNGISLGISIYVDSVKWTGLFDPSSTLKVL